MALVIGKKKTSENELDTFIGISKTVILGH